MAAAGASCVREQQLPDGWQVRRRGRHSPLSPPFVFVG